MNILLNGICGHMGREVEKLVILAIFQRIFPVTDIRNDSVSVHVKRKRTNVIVVVDFVVVSSFRKEQIVPSFAREYLGFFIKT